MTNTGTWKYDAAQGRLVKVSNRIPAVTHDVHVPRDGSGGGGFKPHYDDNLGDWNERTEQYEPYLVTSKKDKKRRMKELGLTERGGKDVKPHGKVQYHDLSVKDRATVFVGRP